MQGVWELEREWRWCNDVAFGMGRVSDKGFDEEGCEACVPVTPNPSE